MKEFNNYIINGNVFMKTFIGASPDELHHYMEKHLDEERPDTCIINVGTNRLGKDDAFKIAEDIIKCVDRCRKFGVNKILVSAITYRPAYRELIKQVNDLLDAKRFINDFTLIYNNNIKADHIWRDGLHLANNIIDALNRMHGHHQCQTSQIRVLAILYF